jgi:hypothetical protein
MLPDILSQYIEDVETAVRILEDVYIERFEVEILTFDRVNLRIRIRFAQGHLLELNEAIIAENESINSLGYRYHFQDDHNRLLFRYDNTPHYPDLGSFPHHKHLADKVISSKKPSPQSAILEAAQKLKEHQ